MQHHERMAEVTRKIQISLPDRLRLFDEASKRQEARRRTAHERSPAGDRGWRRKDLYARGQPR
jgi:hypothetical protein